jgi:hypothetical protein
MYYVYYATANLKAQIGMLLPLDILGSTSLTSDSSVVRALKACFKAKNRAC